MDKIVLPQGENPRASIIVVAWKDAPLLPTCLRSLAGNSSTVTSEVLLVLNDPSPSLVTFVEQNIEGANVIRARVNLGFAAACNRAAWSARGEYLVLLNDDAETEPGWLDALVATADAHPDAGAVGSRILDPDGRLQEAGVIMWSDATTTSVGRGLPSGSSKYGSLRKVDYCSASSLLVRRSSWEAIGGMDEEYFPAYFEDADLCFNLWQRGQTVLYEPGSRIRHHEAASSDPLFKTFLFNRNRSHFKSKWAKELTEQPPPEPHSAAAIETAVARADAREPKIGGAATIERSGIRPEDEFGILQHELAQARRDLLVKEEYMGDLRHLESVGYRMVDKAARAIRRWPFAHRIVQRFTRGIRSARDD